MPAAGEEPLPRLDPVEAIAWFRAKGWAIGFDWRDVWQEEHAKAFTVAKAMSRDLLEDIRAAVDQALTEGETLQTFIKQLRPRLVQRGWWGKAYRTDPQTGESKVVQLGSPARLRTIYETNLRTSYMAGRWQRIERAKKTLPLLRYVSVMDGRERPEHHAWHGTILPVEDPWWDTHFPPCGWGCRCDAQPLNQRMLDRKGWQIQQPQRFPERDYVNKRTGEVTRVERGIDPGWSYNVGKAPLDPLTPAPRAGKSSDAPIGGEDDALANFSDREFALVRGFFSRFGLGTRAAAQRGRVWTDPAGWPLAISLGMLRGADGGMVRLAAREARNLSDAARILQSPDRIALVWVAGENGRPMLVRRYFAAHGVVDIGRDFWRWQSGRVRHIALGLPVWTRSEGAIAAYDPHQARHPKGSRDGGRFRSTGRGAALASLSGSLAYFPTATLGSVSAEAAGRARAHGVDIAGRGVRLEHSYGKKTMLRHGPGRETRGDQRAVTAGELVNAHKVINQAHSFSPQKGRRLPRFLAKATIAGEEHHVVAEISKRNVSVITLYVKRKSAGLHAQEPEA